MIRRLFRWSLAAAWAACVLACLGSAWLWWYTRRVADLRADAAAGGLYAVAWVEVGVVDVVVLRGWPRPHPPRALTGVQRYPTAAVPPGEAPVPHVQAWPDRRAAWWSLWSMSAGPVNGQSLFWADGTPVPRGTPDGPGQRVVTLPGWHVTDVSVGALVLATGVPAVLPLVVRARRAAARRRRSRAGLCATCGYDLTGNASGVCPECGSAVEV